MGQGEDQGVEVAGVELGARLVCDGLRGERLTGSGRAVKEDAFRHPRTEELEPLRFVLHRLTAALVDQLVARGAATGRVELRLSLDPAFARRGSPTAMSVEQRLPEPSSEAEAIERLLFARLERDPPSVAVNRLELELSEVAPASGQQLALFIPQANRVARLRWQLARLALAFGDDRVGRVELADPEAPLAEGRWTWHPVEIAR